MIDIILFVLGSLGLIVGTITDFKKREVADWINYGMMFAGIGLRLINSIITNDYWYLAWGVAWLFICYVFGLVMYYTGQWGGGDCKIIMGLGALFGTVNLSFINLNYDFIQLFLPIQFNYNITFMLHFLFNSFLIGAIYGLIYTIVLMIKNWKTFKEEFTKKLSEKITRYSLIAALILVVFGYLVMAIVGDYSYLLQIALWAIAVLPVMLVFVKAVENGCMIQMMKINDLTEGEWIVEDVKVDGKYITGPKELGITLEQIKKLQKLNKAGKIDEVKVKIGIPFVPAFLLAFIATIIWNNLLLVFLGL